VRHRYCNSKPRPPLHSDCSMLLRAVVLVYCNYCLSTLIYYNSQVSEYCNMD
jgi:hypothetical protein